MKKRITNQELIGITLRLNAATGNPTIGYNKGMFVIDYCNGGVALDRITDDNFSTTNILPRGTKRELYTALSAFVMGVELGKLTGGKGE